MTLLRTGFDLQNFSRDAAAQRVRRFSLACTAIAYEGSDEFFALEALLTEIALGDVLANGKSTGIGRGIIEKLAK